MRTTRTAIAAMAAGVLALSACSGGGDAVDLDGDGSTADGQVEPSSDALVAAIAGEPDQLDPHVTSAYFSFQVLENVFDTLVEPDDSLEMQPALAESWEISDDQLTWTFDLRDDVTFHDGSAFTADDVVYSYTRIIDEELTPSWRFAAIESVTAPDDSTVEITVAQPTPNLLALIGGYKGMAIVSEDNVTSGDIVSAPVGTGPFSFADYVSGDHITLTANPDYWGDAPSVPGVEFRFISEGSTAITALENGEIDWTDSVPVQQVEALSGGDSELAIEPSTDYWYLALNQNNAPWDDVRARQAVAYAIDREAILQATTYGTGVLNQLAIPEQSAWFTEYDEYSYDPERAQELFDEAGFTGGTIDFLATSEYSETELTAQILADNLEPYGIDVEIRTVDFATWLAEQGEGNFDMFMLSWLGNLDPDDFYYAQHHSEGGFNFQGYSNPDVDALLEAGRTETDADARRDLYAEAATMIADDASYIYLYNPAVIQAWSPELSGYTVRSDGAIRFRSVELTG
ncbi:ABC transporter substrate-binding protein [Demequina muriae]|uniref:ABC transporter substrate-binding protein n=1 Tax=Demequina muriae TaxID=3051664 RepID=A0ABT8GHQ7_9MICO|nr:ABC transporter substrate-binding protein [Demequina sp. EGI L300058]MDN4480971.1 ABC transporter substrate-binding protein [Demequina sp. EGI L300058]